MNTKAAKRIQKLFDMSGPSLWRLGMGMIASFETEASTYNPSTYDTVPNLE